MVKIVEGTRGSIIENPDVEDVMNGIMEGRGTTPPLPEPEEESVLPATLSMFDGPDGRAIATIEAKDGTMFTSGDQESREAALSKLVTMVFEFYLINS